MFEQHKIVAQKKIFFLNSIFCKHIMVEYIQM